MGRNHKKAQRTKNNEQPSSSSRCSELLRNSSTLYTALSQTNDGGPSSHGFFVSQIEELDPNMDANFQIVLKKMSKKDSTTKLKALHEFATLINESEEDTIKTIIPFWPRLYTNLSVDCDNRVREAANQAQRSVVKKAKRNFAPYLRQLAGSWFTSQYDNYPPAATAAAQSFQDAFPPHKLIEAISFCKKEIFGYIFNVLTIQTLETAKKQITATPEEVETKYHRIVGCCLQAYALLLEKLPPEQLELEFQSNKDFVSSKKFWKVAETKEPVVRRAWFSALTSLIHHAPQLVSDQVPRIMLTIFKNLDEPDSTISSNVWETLLYSLTTFEDCWSHVNMQKLVVPKVMSVLREGAWGNASNIFPNLLPFLSKIPPTLRSDDLFYNNFFDNMRKCLNERNVYLCQSECNAVAEAYIECLQYVILMHQEDTNFCLNLLQDHLIPTLNISLRDQKLQRFSQAFFYQVAVAVHHYNSKQDSAVYAKLADHFWELLPDVFFKLQCSNATDSLYPIEPPSDYTLTQQVKFCDALRNPSTQKKKQNLRVKFQIDVDSAHVNMENNDNHGIVLNCGNDILLQKLQAFVQIVCASYLDSTLKLKTPIFINHLETLVSLFNSRELYETLANGVVTKYIVTDGNQNLVLLFEETFRKWLESPDDEMCVNSVVFLIFGLTKHVSSNEKEYILNNLFEVCNDKVLLWSISACLDHHMDSDMSKFLQSTVMSHALCTLTNIICSSENNSQHRKVLKSCMTRTSDGELIISSEAVTNILSMLSAHMKTSTSEVCASFAGDLIRTFYDSNVTLVHIDNLDDATMEAMEMLFSFSCRCSSDLENQLNETCQTVIRAMVKVHGVASQPFLHLVKHLSKIVENILSREELSLSSTNDIAHKVIGLMNASTFEFFEYENQRSASVKLGSWFLDSFFVKLNTWQHDLINMCLYAEHLNGVLSCFDEPHYTVNTLKMIDGGNASHLGVNSDIEKYATIVYFIMSFISKMSENVVHERVEVKCSEDQLEQEKKIQPEIYINSLNYLFLENHISSLIYVTAAFETFNKHFNNTIYCKKLLKIVSNLKASLQLLIMNLNVADIDIIKENAIKRAKVDGGLWTVAVHMLYADILKEENLKSVYLHLISKSENLIGPLHASQVFVAHVNIEHLSPDCEGEYNFSDLAILTRWLLNMKCSLTEEHQGIVKIFINSLFEWMEKKSTQRQLIMDCNVISCDWLQVQNTTEAVQFLTAVVEKCCTLLNSDNWDFLLISLTSWMLSVNCSSHDLLMSRSNHESLFIPISAQKHKTVVFTSATLKLLQAISLLFDNPLENELLSENAFYKKLLSEWTDVFADEIYQVQITFFEMVSISSMGKIPSLPDLLLLENLGSILMNVDVSKCLQKNKSVETKPSCVVVLNCCCRLINNSVTPLQLAAYHVLLKLVPSLVEVDKTALNAKGNDVEMFHKELQLWELQETLGHIQAEIKSSMVEIGLEDNYIFEPFTHGHTNTTAYLLLWNIVGNMCNNADSELRYQYASSLAENGFIDTVLQVVFHLMPVEVLQSSEVPPRTLKQIILAQYFSSGPSLEFSNVLTIEFIQHLSCWVYYILLSQLPVLVRKCWGELESRLASQVDKMTTQFLSPSICLHEMQIVQNHAKCHDDISIKVFPNVREVVAVYRVDEAHIDLTIQLPTNYPLTPVKLTGKKHLIDSVKWRTWIMQLTVFLTHQNGSIWDGLMLWKNNLDKKFGGLEECYICFCVIHSSNYQTPKLSCSTCKKKFHSPCLYKWFTTSNKATCPICRDIF